MDNAAEIRSLLGPTGFIGKLSRENVRNHLAPAASEARETLRSEIVARTPVEFNHLRDAIRVSLDQMLDRVGYHLVSDIDTGIAPYGYFVERGTGVYGPLHRPYSVVSAHWMSFFWRRYGTKSLAGPPLGTVNQHMRVQQVKGQPAQEFLLDGWTAATNEIAPRFWDDFLARL